MQSTNITKFFGILAGVLTLFVMFFVVAPQKTFAQLQDDGGNGLPPCTGEIGEIEGVTCEYPDIPYPNPSSTPPSTTSTTGDKVPDLSCNVFYGWKGIQQCLAVGGYTIMMFFNLFLGIAGVLLNAAVNLTVQNMAPFVNGAGDATTAVEVAWKLFRDLGNIVILFVLLFSSIGIILRTDVLVPRGTLAKIIIAAFLINFSLFFTKVIIDVSNVFTFTLHNQIEEISEKNAQPGKIKLGVAGAFMQGLNPQANLAKMAETLKATSGGQIAMNILFQSILGSLVLIIATFVFLVMAMMLFVRFVILLVLLITSPLGFVGSLIPKLQSYSKQWWSTLIGQAMFAPILLLFMLITILLINGGGIQAALDQSNPLAGSPEVNSVLAFAAGGVPTILMYFLIIALMIIGLVVAKSTAGKFGSGAVDWASKKAGSLAFGTTAGIGRGTLGRFGATLTDENSRFGGAARRMAASNNLISRSFGAGVIASGDKLKKATFDVRNTAAGKQLEAGKGGKGYEAWYKEQKKNRENEFKNVGAPSGATNAALRRAQRGELSARETLRRVGANDTTGRINAESALASATKARKDAENRAKLESAQSREQVGQREQQYARTAQGTNRIGSLWTTIVSPADREAARTVEESARKELNKLNLGANKSRLEKVNTELQKLREQGTTWGTYNKEKDEIDEAPALPGSSKARADYERLKKELSVIESSVNSAEDDKKKNEEKEKIKKAVEEIEKEKPQESSGGGEKPADKPAA